MYNISFTNFRVTDEPLEVNETWTKMMYICLFVGGFWCGAVTFIMLLAIHTHCEQLRTRQRRGPVTTTSPFWVDWQSLIASRLTRRDWAVTTDDEARFKQSGLRGFLVWGGGSISVWCRGHWKHGQGARCSGYPLLEAIWESSVAENMQPLWIRWVFRDLL